MAKWYDLNKNKFGSDVVENIKCPKCGRDMAVCGYWNSGEGPYQIIDNFIHECQHPDCGYKVSMLGGQGRDSPYEDSWPHCPFCGRRAGL